MIRAVRARLTYSNVIASIALFVALGGGAYALSNNSVKSRHIVNGEVKSGDLQDDGVKSEDVRDGTLTADDVGNVKLSGGSAALAEDVTLASTPLGTFDFHCSGSPTLSFMNQSGTDATVLSKNRQLVFEDDGTPGNGQVGMTHEVVADLDTSTASSVSGAGAIGWAEFRVLGDQTVAIASVEAFTPVDGCEYIARVEHAPRG